jgi:hypothetical protein
MADAAMPKLAASTCSTRGASARVRRASMSALALRTSSARMDMDIVLLSGIGVILE